MADLKRCFHCNAPMQVYRRSLRKDQIKALFILYHEHGKPKKVSEMKSRLSIGAIGDMQKLRHWDLITGDNSGHWWITIKGAKFLRNEITIPKYIWTYRNNVIDQPKEDKIVNPLISAKDIGFEIYNKEIAIMNSTPKTLFVQTTMPLV